MPLSSMTGFARQEGVWKDDQWSWEMRSVNSRNLDLRLRVPSTFEGLEADLRAIAAEAFRRGSIQVALHFQRGNTAPEITVNRDALSRILAVREELGQDIDTAPLSIEALMNLKGVIETREPEEDDAGKAERLKAMKESFAAALTQLKHSRDLEGEKIQLVLGSLIERIESLVSEATAIAETIPATLKARLSKQIDELLAEKTGISEERLAQEVALLVTKADVREEIDRLNAHCATARELLNVEEPVGRKLDFLTQEFNRESNTLCSKSVDVELTRIGLELKTVVDQLREQVQNIE